MGMPITVKGQVTIPKPIRDRLGLKPGGQVDFVVEPDGRVVLQRAAEPAAPEDRFRAVMGCATAMEGMTTDELMLLLRGPYEDL
jgi:AbrB family looped-hinge helix DNA binding protein